MEWLRKLLTEPDSVAHTALMLTLVAGLGLALGAIKFRGLGLGVAGVLFTGLIFGHFKAHVNKEVLEFVREFGLILFVYTIGVQVGPGFFASLKRQGLALNVMAASIVLLGVIVTLGIYFARMDRSDPRSLPATVGLFSGATTNTPSLAASGQALRESKQFDNLTPAQKEEALKQPGLAYAVAYPFGIMGIIIAMLLIKWFFRVNLDHETQILAALDAKTAEKLQTINLEVTNPNINNVPVRDVPTIGDSGAVISRILKKGSPKPTVARGNTILNLGDIVHVVGPRESLEDVRIVVGVESATDIKKVPGQLTSRRILVTKSEVLGKSIRELNPLDQYGVTVTRISRAEVELPVTPATRLQFGDSLVVVGEPEDIQEMAHDFGDSLKRLNHPQVVPLFLGVALGVTLGAMPIPGLPAVKLGLAGGPLVVAILLSRIGNIGPLVWYMPISANMMVRELGIALFLACVGLKCGGEFVNTLNSHGWEWLIYGALITFLPLIIVAMVGRFFLKTNFLSLCGVLAGSMTDPPALAFAGSITHSEAPSIAYATVYPLVMLLRIVLAQGMVLILLQ